MSQGELFGDASQGRGRTESALLADLARWADQGHHVPASVVAALREGAYNVDASKPGQGKAQAVSHYLTQLRDYAPGESTDDTWADFLRHASTAQVPDDS